MNELILPEPFLFGKVKCTEEEAGYRADRFTGRQKQCYGCASPYFPEPFFDGYFARNCETDANVMLDLETDSLHFGLEIGKAEPVNGSRNNCFDVLVNGRLRYHGDAEKSFFLSLRPGRKRVTVFFPYFGCVWLRGLRLDGGCYAAPVRKKGLWLALGDSITHGCNAVFPSRSYVSRLAMRVGAEVINQGNAGYVYDADVLDSGLHPDVVTVAYGINDAGRKPLDRYAEDMHAFYKRLLNVYPCAQIFVLSPIWAKTMSRPEHLEKYRSIYGIFEEIAGIYRLKLIDGRHLVPHNPEYYDDAAVVHPNDKGFSYYAARLYRQLAPAFELEQVSGCEQKRGDLHV